MEVGVITRGVGNVKPIGKEWVDKIKEHRKLKENDRQRN